MLVAAVAAGQLRTSLDVAGAPCLAVQGDVVSVELMAAKTISTGVPAAAARLPALLLWSAYFAHVGLHATVPPHAAGIATTWPFFASLGLLAPVPLHVCRMSRH